MDKAAFEKYKLVENKLYLEFDKAPWSYQEYLLTYPKKKFDVQRKMFNKADKDSDGLLNEEEHHNFQRKVLDELLKDSETK